MDWGTDSANDDQSSIDEDIAETAGIGPEQRQVPITLTNEEYNLLDKQLQILVANLDSIGLNCNNKINNFVCPCSDCEKCKGNKNSISFLGDSGASMTFTSECSDFTTYEEINNGLNQQEKIQLTKLTNLY